MTFPTINFPSADFWSVAPTEDFDEKINFKSVCKIQHEAVVGCVSHSRDGRWLATGSDRCTFVFDVENFYLLKTRLEIHSDYEMFIRALCFSASGSFLFSGSEDGYLRMWSLKTKSLSHTFVGHTGDIAAIDASVKSERPFVASGSSDGTVRVWDLDSGKCVTTISVRQLADEQTGVSAIAFNAECTWIAVGCSLPELRIYQRCNGALLHAIAAHTQAIYSLSLSPDNLTIASASLDSTLSLWRAPAATCAPDRPPELITTFTEHAAMCFSCVFSSNNRWVLSGSADKSIQLHDASRNTLAANITGFEAAGKHVWTDMDLTFWQSFRSAGTAAGW